MGNVTIPIAAWREMPKTLGFSPQHNSPVNPTVPIEGRSDAPIHARCGGRHDRTPFACHHVARSRLPCRKTRGRVVLRCA